MLPSTYSPQTPADFVGPARQIATSLQRLATTAGRSPVKVLFTGRPGIGKTTLAGFLNGILGASKHSTHRYNGTGLRIDDVEDIRRDLRFRDMFGNRRTWWVEEVDKVPHLAQVALLTLLDDLPNDTAFIATTNQNADTLEERFHTRFMVIEVPAPSAAEIAELLQRWLPVDTARRIAEFACGNVRQALADANLALMTTT